MTTHPTTVTNFNLSDLPDEDRFDTWKESISVIFDVNLPERISSHDFKAEVSCAHLGHLILGQTKSLSQYFNRPLSRIHRDGIDHCLIQVYLEGETRGVWGDRRHSIARPGDVLFLDTAQTIQSQTSNFRNLTAVIPRTLLTQHMRAPERFHGHILPRESSTGRLLSEHIQTLWRILPSTPACQTPSIGAALTDLVGRYFDEKTQPIELEESSYLALTLRETIRAYIEQVLELHDLGPSLLANKFGLSRSALYKMFAPLGGVSRYIWTRRLIRAHSELTSSPFYQGHITNIAFRLGFKDASHFSRAYREQFGYSPKETYESHFLFINTPASKSELVDRSYEHWIRRLR